MIKLAIIGTGPIVPYHLDVFRNLGFTFEILVYRTNFKMAAELQLKYGIRKITSDIDDLEQKEVDCILLATNVDSLGFLLKTLVLHKVPILVEKPAAIASSVFDSLPAYSNLITQVGYNRRFYSSVKSFRQSLALKSNIRFEVRLPENSWNGVNTVETFIKILKSNTVHGIDLLFFIFGEDCAVESIDTEISDDKVDVIRCKISSKSKSGLLTIFNGVPDNYLITAFNRGYKAELTPLETFAFYNGIKVQEPHIESPIRRYLPVKESEWKISQADIIYKPGFLEQANAFKHLVESGKFYEEAATIDDARRAIKFCEIIEEQIVKGPQKNGRDE